MIWSDAVQGQAECFFDAGGNQLRMAVQDVGRRMGEISVCGKQVATEQETAGFTVETAVAIGVAGQMNDFQATPDWNRFAIFKPMVDLKR